MKKFLCNVTDCIGWFFVEVADRMFSVSDHNWAWPENADNYRWFMRPYGWVASGIYWLGNWFYGVLDDHSGRGIGLTMEAFSQHHGASALELAGQINDITCEILDEIEDAKDEDKAIDGDMIASWQVKLEEAHWLSHEFECRLGGHGGTEYATGPLLKEME